MDAPELAQTCNGADGSAWPCGVAARQKLQDVLAKGEVRCDAVGRDRYGRLLARCGVGGIDLGQAMVRAGLAVSDGDYFLDQAAASADGTGIWRGTFMAPAQWRAAHADVAPSEGLIEVFRRWFR